MAFAVLKELSMSDIMRGQMETAVLQADISPALDIKELTSRLDPALQRFGYSRMATTHLIDTLRNAGITKEVIQAYLRRRKQVRELIHRQKVSSGEIKAHGRNTRVHNELVPERESFRVRYKASTDAALQAEMEALQKKLDTLGLAFKDGATQFVVNLDELRGELTVNKYARILNALANASGATEFWHTEYHKTLRRKSEYIRKGKDVSLLGWIKPLRQGTRMPQVSPYVLQSDTQPIDADATTIAEGGPSSMQIDEEGPSEHGTWWDAQECGEGNETHESSEWSTDCTLYTLAIASEQYGGDSTSES